MNNCLCSVARLSLRFKWRLEMGILVILGNGFDEVGLCESWMKNEVDFGFTDRIIVGSFLLGFLIVKVEVVGFSFPFSTSCWRRGVSKCALGLSEFKFDDFTIQEFIC